MVLGKGTCEILSLNKVLDIVATDAYIQILSFLIREKYHAK